MASILDCETLHTTFTHSTLICVMLLQYCTVQCCTVSGYIYQIHKLHFDPELSSLKEPPVILDPQER